MAGLLKKIFSNPITSPVGYAYKKIKEQKSKDKAQNNQVEKGQRLAIRKEKLAAPVFKTGLKELENQIKGKGEGPATHLRDIQKRMERAGKGAEEFYEPIKQQALSDFKQSYQPEIVNQYGRESGSGSSALNQALAAAQSNLSRGLASDFAGFKTNYAQNIFGQSQAAKQAAQQQRYAAASQAIGQPSAYTPPTMMAPSSIQRYGSLATGVVGGIAGAIAGGPPGAVGGYQLGSQAGQTLFG